ILTSIFVRRPVAPQSADVMPQLVADTQRLGGFHARFLLSPTAPLESRDGAPIAVSEGNHILFAHQPRIAPLHAGRSRKAPPAPELGASLGRVALSGRHEQP